MKISSRESKHFKRLYWAKKRKNEFFIVEGTRAIEQMTQNEYHPVAIYSSDENTADIYLIKELFEEISSVEHSQGRLALFGKIKGNTNLGKQVLVLNRVQDPGNVGTLLRSALAFGYHDVLLSKGCVDVYNDKVLRSSLGALISLNVVENLSNEEILHLLKGYHLYVSTLEEAQNHREVFGESPFAIVLGSEAFGVDSEFLNQATKKVKIPMQSSMESLNVAIAGSILMEHFQA